MTPTQRIRYERTVEGFTGLEITPETAVEIAGKREYYAGRRALRETPKAITWPEVDRRRDQNWLVRVDLQARFRRRDDRPLTDFGGL